MNQIFTGTAELFLNMYHNYLHSSYCHKTNVDKEFNRIKQILAVMGVTNEIKDLFDKDTFDKGFLLDFRNSICDRSGRKSLASTMNSYCIYFDKVCMWLYNCPQ